MKNIQVLDCTLRDGGRIINCAFPDSEIRDLSGRLAHAGIDIIEVGFLRDARTVHYEGNSTFFTDVDQIRPFLDRRSGAMYVAFIDYGLFDIDSLPPATAPPSTASGSALRKRIFWSTGRTFCTGSVSFRRRGTGSFSRASTR